MMPGNSHFDWIIIGGGVHGTYIANALISHNIVKRQDLCIIDPNRNLLSEWKRVTRNVGMDFLRSPNVHHLDMEPFSLKRFAERKNDSDISFIPPNERPSLALFNDHADRVIHNNGLQELTYQTRAKEISIGNNHILIGTDNEQFKTKHAVIAIGRSECLRWPEWAVQAKKQKAAITHVFDDTFNHASIPETGRILVVGGGMSAVQTALALANPRRHVVLLTPHTIKQKEYDADPGWMGPKYLAQFRKITSCKRRRSLITSARNTGTITTDLKQKILRSQKNGEISLVTDQVYKCIVLTNHLMLLHVKSGGKISANQIILATGYQGNRPGKAMIDQLIEKHQLRCSECGYPITDPSLQWHEGLYVSGAMAELEVGPAAANIIGARMAAEKMLTKKYRRAFVAA